MDYDKNALHDKDVDKKFRSTNNKEGIISRGKMGKNALGCVNGKYLGKTNLVKSAK